MSNEKTSDNGLEIGLDPPSQPIGKGTENQIGDNFFDKIPVSINEPCFEPHIQITDGSHPSQGK